jgi:ubiquinone/menaquinone biosynthesis C-methylase UbiE
MRVCSFAVARKEYMVTGRTLLCCKRCGSVLTQKSDGYHCDQCMMVFPVDEDIILMEEKGSDHDLRIGDVLLDLYALRNRKYYAKYIESDVEYIARLHSLDFLNCHAEHLSPYLSNSVVLDLGCGQLPYIGSFPETKVKEFYGLDLSLDSLKIARRHFKGTFPLILVRHGVRDIPFRDGCVDVAVSSEVLEHLDHPQDYLREIYRVVKKGGYLSLSTPNAAMYLYPHNLFCIATDPREWFKRMNCHKRWHEALLWHPGLRPKILRNWIQKAGFSIVHHVTRLWYSHTPVRLMWRFLFVLEKAGLSCAGSLFSDYLRMMDRLLKSKIPVISKAGIRQFVLCRK